MKKHSSCANISPVTAQRCNHGPHIGRVCQHCGCGEYIHGLENEMDRQLAACVGKAKTVAHCTGFGAKLGQCGSLVFADSNGFVGRLCSNCLDEWLRLNIEEQEAGRGE